MNTQNFTRNTSTDAAFAHINAINMEVAMELLGQVIAKQSAAIDDEEKGDNNQAGIGGLQDEMQTLRRRQQGPQ